MFLARLAVPGLAAALAVVLSVSVFGTVAPARAADAEAADKARAFVVELADKTITSLTEDGIDKTERRKRFRVLMLENFAFEGIAKWVLGRYWRRASAEEQAEFLKLFEDLMVVIYADRFAQYSGEKLDVGKGEVRGENDILVHSVINRPEGLKPVDVIWRMRQVDAAFKILDLMVEGLSMGLTQQKEFSSVIRQNGGQIRGLLNELKKRLDANS